MKVLRFCFILVLSGVLATAYGLEPLPLGTLPGSQALAGSPVRFLQAVTRDARFIACRKDLEIFVSNLSASDYKEIQSQQTRFDSKKLIQILKTKIPNAAGFKTEVDADLKSVAILIPHGNLKCQVSIYPTQEDDQLKANPDPTSADLKIRLNSNNSFQVEATLAGVSADAKEGGTIHLAPTKAMTLLRQQGIQDLETQIQLLGEFQATESAAAPATGGPPQSGTR